MESRLDIHVLRHSHKKPSQDCLIEILDYYRANGKQEEEVKANELLFVGDRILTDIAFGNLCGMATCFTKILTEEGDNRAAKYIRRAEVKATNKLLQRGWLPKAHWLFPYEKNPLNESSSPSKSSSTSSPKSSFSSSVSSSSSSSSQRGANQNRTFGRADGDIIERNENEIFYHSSFSNYLI